MGVSYLRAFQGLGGCLEMGERKESISDGEVCCEPDSCLLHIRCMAQPVLNCMVSINYILLS